MANGTGNDTRDGIVHRKKFINFDGKITIGNLIVMAGILFSLFAGYYRTQASIEDNTEGVTENRTSIKELDMRKLEKNTFNSYKGEQRDRSEKLDSAIEKLSQAVISLDKQIAIFREQLKRQEEINHGR